MKCLNCNSSNTSFWKKICGYDLYKCNQCSLLMTQFSLTKRKKYITEKYSSEYADNYKKTVEKLKPRFKKQLEEILKYKTNGTLLDVGCGPGFFLQYFRQSTEGWKIFGVEPNKILRKAASANSLSVIKNGTLNKLPFPKNYFDVITCFDVLEHSSDLKKNIDELYRVLKPNGILLVQCPNYESFMAKITGKNWDWWCIPDHILHFSPKSLRAILGNDKLLVKSQYTYEDTDDFLSNIKGTFCHNKLQKMVMYLLIPVLLLIERVCWALNLGGLNSILLQK